MPRHATALSKVLAKTGGMCVYCGCHLDDTWVVEHAVPRSKGGGNHLANRFPSCSLCNARKKDCTPEEFRSRISSRIAKAIVEAQDLVEVYRPEGSPEILAALETASVLIKEAHIAFNGDDILKEAVS
jgi:hypothetical protein